MFKTSIIKKLKLYISYVIPTIIVMCISGTYNIIDSVFIGKNLGYIGLISFSAIAPIIFFINNGIATLLNSGAAVKISQSIGNKNIKDANQYFGTMIFLNIVVCFLISGGVFLLIERVLNLFNLSEEMSLLSNQYISVMVFGSAITVLSTSTSLILKNYGHPIFSMSLILISFFMNIILDYFMVPTMGMFGAGLATIISQSVLLLLDIFIFYYILKYQYNLKKYNILPNISKIKDILITGFPSFGQPISIFLVLFLYDLILSKLYNPILLSGYACISGIVLIGSMIITGIVYGLRPLLSKAYGRKQPDELLNLLKFGVILSIITGFLIIMLLLGFANIIPILFGLSGNIAKVTTVGIILSSLVFIPLGIVKLFYVYFQSINKIFTASALSFTGSLVIFPICLSILNYFLGVPGIWLSMPAMYLIMLILLIIQLLISKKKSGKFIITNIKEN